VVTGQPGSGKSTWVAARAVAGDVTVDFDVLACALTPSKTGQHVFPQYVRQVTSAAWFAAVKAALRISSGVDVYVIHAYPSRAMTGLYRRYHAVVVNLDSPQVPGSIARKPDPVTG